jgi:metal-sulfur cluster biosynthetic enzyme
MNYLDSSKMNVYQERHMEEQKLVISETQIIEALKECYDPEIPVNLVDLGLIYDIKIIEDWVGVKMTLTSPGCGMSGMISQNVRNRVLKVPGVKDADVRIVWDPAWSPARMSPEAKKKLGMPV